MRLSLAVLALAVGTCASAQPAPRGPDGYRNNYPHAEKASFWAWQWERLRDGVPKPPPGGWNLPAVRTDPAELRAPEGNPSVTWIGHATVLVRLAGRHDAVRPDLLRARLAAADDRAEARRAAADRHRRAAEDRRGDDLAQSLRPPRRGDGAQARRDAAGQPALPRAARAEGWFAEPRHRARRRATTGGRRRREGAARDHVRAGAALEPAHARPTPTRRCGAAGSSRARACALIHTGDTGYSKDFRDIGERLGRSTWRSSRSAPTRRAGSCR